VRLALAALAILAATTPAPAQNIRTLTAARDAWTAIREGRNEAAARAFEDALRDLPREPSLHFGLGLASHLLGQASRARAELTEALRLAPDYTDASLLLGELLYRAGTVEEAVRVYEEALTHAPGTSALDARLQQWRDELALQRDFYQSHGQHFTVLFEGPADEPLAAKAVELLESAYWRVSTALSTYPEAPVTVVLYTEQQFRDVTRSPDWAAASYDGRIRVPVRGALRHVDELERVLAHEFTHVIVRTLAPTGVPTWLNEGLAVAFEPNGTAWSRSQLSGSGTRVPSARLHDGFGGFSPADARMAYAQSGAAVQRLLDTAGAHAIAALLRDIARGEPFADAFAYRMLMPYDDFLASLRASTWLGAP
jgi:tetratricopeptide (TPR) repeat protein